MLLVGTMSNFVLPSPSSATVVSCRWGMVSLCPALEPAQPARVQPMLSPIRVLVPGLQFGLYVIHDSSGMLKPLDVPLKGLDVPQGSNIVIRVQDGSREL